MKGIHAVYLTCLLAALIISSGPASGFSIMGAIWQEDVNPGESVSHEINISEDSSDNPTNYTIEVAGLVQTLQGVNTPAMEGNDTNPYTARPFLKVSTSSFYLEPGKSQIVLVKADIPKDVGSGSRFAIISMRSGTIGSNANGGANVGIRTGSDIPVVLTTAGSEMDETGKITDIKEDKVSAEQQIISVIFKNTGNTLYKAKAKAELKSTDGTIVVQAETPIGVASIIPPFSRLFQISLNPSSKLKPGMYNLTSSVEKEDGTVLATNETSLKV